MKTKGLFAAMILALAGAGTLLVPSPAPPQQKKTQERKIPPQKQEVPIKVDVTVTAITIAVTVQDRGGKYVNDLEAKDFTVYENNFKRTITYFKHDDQAAESLAVLLDVSGSMAVGDKLEEAKVGLRSLVQNLLRPKDEIALLIFAESEVEVAAPFSTDRTRFLEELDKVQAYGQTALNDAVAVSPEFANRGKNEKRALLLVTDGVENASQVDPEKALQIARRVDVPIYTIGYKIPLAEQLAKLKRQGETTSTGIIDTLTKFSRATGGKAFFVNDPGAMYASLREIAKEQSQQYIIGYTSYKDTSREYRKITVVTSNKRLKVRTREGY
jgi:Ca-activated chloride channel homolog